MSEKAPETQNNPAGQPAPVAQAENKPKKKLSLEINDLSEVIERKISPAA